MNPATQPPRADIRVDLQLIADMIKMGSRVLDVGCGEGELLEYLTHFKQVDGRGVEISTEGVNACVSAGLSVIQGDANVDLADYPDHAFDYVVLSQTLQAMQNPRWVIENMLRIGRHAVVSFPNFAYWKVRLHLLMRGRMPVSDLLPHKWYNTPNIHLCTIRDFRLLCSELGISVERSIALHTTGTPRAVGPLANLLGEQAVFLLRKD